MHTNFNWYKVVSLLYHTIFLSYSRYSIRKHLSHRHQLAFRLSGQSNVGNSQVFEDGDQKNVPHSKLEEEKKDAQFHEGKENSHKANDFSRSTLYPHAGTVTNLKLPENEISIANKLARKEKEGFISSSGAPQVKR